MDTTMHKPLCGLVIALIMLCGGGCREHAGSFNDQAFKAFMANNQTEAVRLFNRSLALDPDNLVAHFYLGWIYKMQGKTDEGISEFKKVIELYPEHDGAYSHLGDLYRARGMLDEAIEAYRKVIMLKPDNAAGYYKLGMAYQQKGKVAESADAFFEAGLLAVIRNDKEMALNAYNHLNDTGNTQLAIELQGVLNPWFDPAGAAAAGDRGSRSTN